MIKILTYEQHEQNEKFYSIMGRFFASRDCAKEMGGWQFYNKDNSTWLLAYEGKDLIGFCALFEENTHVFMDNFYILKSYRGKGYSRTLFDYRLKFAKGLNKEIRVITNNPFQMKNYERNGFTHYGDRGQYRKYKVN